jgi:hypothetical protein
MSLPALSPVARVLWILLAILVVGFLLGRWLNRRRSKAIGEWLQAGIRVLGAQTSWRFPGGISSGAEVKVINANAPFSQIEIGYYLLTREFPVLWVAELLRGKRDMLAVRGDLRGRPAHEYEVVPLQGALRRTLDQHADERGWRWTAMPAGLGMATRDPATEGAAAKIRAFLEVWGPGVQRLSMRDRKPNLVLFVHFPAVEGRPAREFLQAVRRLVDPTQGPRS